MAAHASNFFQAVKDVGRLLTFRLTSEDFARFGWHHLVVGLLFTWLVGMGRWWDDSGANVLQHLGVGSVIYIFILSAILWFEVVLLRPKTWSYVNVVTFVSMTAPPAALYAIPVEEFMTLEGAQFFNLIFLGVVSVWRVALLAYYVRVLARLSGFAVTVATLLPLTGIVTTLTILNLERAAFATMGGFRGEATSHDSAYSFLMVLTMMSVLLFIPLFVAYVVLAALAWNRDNQAPERPEPS